MSKDEQAIEAEIQAKNLNAPRLSPEKIDAVITGEDYHVFPGTTLTVCCLTLRNGFTVTGESACASPENFDSELGGKKVNLMIMAGQEDGGNDAVSISLNGYMYQIPRNVNCKVPSEVAEIVQNAVVMQYIPGPKGTSVERAAPRFAFTVTPVAA